MFNFVSLQICDRTFLFLDFTITPPAELPKLVFCNFHDILLLFISFYLINKNWTQSKDSLVKMKMLFSEILNKSTKVFCALGPSAYWVPTSSAELSIKLCVCERMNVHTFVCMPADNEDSKPNSSPLWIVTGARLPGISTALSPLHPISMPKPQNFYKWTCTASINPTSTPKLQNFYKYICTASGKLYVCQHISVYQVCNLCELDDLR